MYKMNNIFNREEYLQYISESKDIIIKNNDEDYDRYIDGDRIFNSDEKTQIYFDRISKNLRKIKNTEISRISGDYESIEDDIVDNFDIIRENESLYELIKDIKTSGYIDLSDIINDDYILWFNKIIQRSKVGKGEFLLPILFSDVYKATDNEKYDDFILHNDEKFPIEIKASIQGSWDHYVPKNEPKEMYSLDTENEYKSFVAETIYNYCKGRKLDNMYLIFFDINLNGILVINTNNTKEELTKIIYDCVDIIDNVIAKDTNFNSFCFDKKIKCAFPKRNCNINDNTISINVYVNKYKTDINKVNKESTRALRKSILKKASTSKLSDIQNELKNIKHFSQLSREEQVAYIYFEKKLSQRHSDIADILYGDRSKATTSSKYVSIINTKYGGYSNWLKYRASSLYKKIIENEKSEI